MTEPDDKRDTRRMKAILTLVATLAFVTSPFYSGGFGGFEPGQFPVPQDDPPVQPAGYAFAIWSVIYLWLVAHAGFGLVARADDTGWDAARWPLIVSLVVGTPWITVAQQSPVAATVMIWVMWAGAALALIRAARAGADRWWLAAPIGLYAGWLTAASCVSLGLLAGGYGLVGLVPAAWLALVIALALAVAVMAFTRVPEYALAVAWALVAVAVANLPGQAVLAAAALIGAGVMLYRGAMAIRARS